MSYAFAFELGWLGCGKCIVNPHPNLSPKIYWKAIFRCLEISTTFFEKPTPQWKIRTYISIALGIFKQIKDEFGRLSGPSSLSIWMTVLGLSSPTNTTAEASKGNGLFVSQHILQIPLRFDQRQLPKCKCCLPCVLMTDKRKYEF